MQTVIKHIASNGIAESVEEVGAHGDGCHIEPSLVVNEVGKLLERELLSALRLQTFLGKESASQCHHRCNNTEHGTNDSILMCGCSTYHLLEIRERKQGDESHGISTHHTERRELVLLIIILGHHTEQRAVRHIHHGIYRHHQQIEGVSIDSLAHRTEVWCIEQEGEYQSERNGTIDEPRTVGTETALGTVGKSTHQRVSNHIEHAGYEHQYCRIRKRESEDICKKQRKSDRHHLPYNTTRSGITQCISYFFF